jgi:ankyrin repeat protein
VHVAVSHPAPSLAQAGEAKNVAALLDLGASIDGAVSTTGQTALLAAIQFKQFAVAELLLSRR